MPDHQPSNSSPTDQQFSDEETARRRDEVIRRMANTPPQAKSKRTPKANRLKAKAKAPKTARGR